MFAMILSSLVLALAAEAKVLPRASPIRTLTVALPTQAALFSTTIRGCDTVEPFAVVGTPTGTFFPGTSTIYLPPQADPTSTTIVDPVSNATEVLICSPLPGDCAEFPFPAPPSPSGTASPLPSPDICPEKGCSGGVVKAATIVIDAINKVTLLSQNLQSAAKRIGTSGTMKRDNSIAQTPIDDVALGLNNIAVTLTTASPRFLFLSPFPQGCDTDTIVIALIEFVRVHQALLAILIGQAGLLPNAPIKRDAPENGAVQLYERDNEGFIGYAIAKALRAVEGIVDTTAFTILKLCPTRSQCAKNQKDAIDGSLAEAIKAYGG